MKRHRPLHIHPDNSVLFLTARIYGGFSYLTPKETKTYLFKKASSVLGKYELDLDAFVVLDNHYHLLLRVNEGQFFANFVRELHGATARFIKKGFAPLVTDFGQRLVKEVTPWDKRQTRMLGIERGQLERELKFANTEEERADVIAQFTSLIYEAKRDLVAPKK